MIALPCDVLCTHFTRYDCVFSLFTKYCPVLVNALRSGDPHSRSQLGEYLDCQARSQSRSDSAKLDFTLIAQARLLIDRANTHRVETWILSYETSDPYSQRRSLCNRCMLRRNLRAIREQDYFFEVSFAEALIPTYGLLRSGRLRLSVIEPAILS